MSTLLARYDAVYVAVVSGVCFWRFTMNEQLPVSYSVDLLDGWREAAVVQTAVSCEGQTPPFPRPVKLISQQS